MSDINSEKLNKFVADRNKFSIQTFGTIEQRNHVGPLMHLKKEIEEVINAPNDRLEWADCFLLLLDAAFRNGYSMQDLIDFGIEKLEINKKRTWTKNKDGTFSHVK